jgi:hypothetical protein
VWVFGFGFAARHAKRNDDFDIDDEHRRQRIGDESTRVHEDDADGMSFDSINAIFEFCGAIGRHLFEE